MIKYLFLFVFIFLGVTFILSGGGVSGQQSPTLTAELFSSPPEQTVPAGTQGVDAAKIRLIVSGGDIYLKGFYVDVDGPGGLANVNSILLYDTADSSLVGAYPVASENPNLIEVGTFIFIGSGQIKTYLLRVGFTPSAVGDIRVGFSGFTFATEAVPDLVNVPIYGNTITVPGTIEDGELVESTPTSTPTPTPTPTPTVSKPTPTELGFTDLEALNLTEGDTISAAGSDDPDIYIANEHGYKRLFLNPVIFGFYGHLGGFPVVKNVVSDTRDTLVTSGLFRNCEINDERVFGLETTGEDTGVLHWVNTTGDQAVADDPEFFKKVFCVNSNEFNWYSKGADYTSVNQVPDYTR